MRNLSTSSWQIEWARFVALVMNLRCHDGTGGQKGFSLVFIRGVIDLVSIAAGASC